MVIPVAMAPVRLLVVIFDKAPMRLFGRSGGCVGVVAIFSSTSSPFVNFPKAVYLPSRKLGLPWQMKNWLPAESGSLERAIEMTPRSWWRSLNSALIL